MVFEPDKGLVRAVIWQQDRCLGMSACLQLSQAGQYVLQQGQKWFPVVQLCQSAFPWLHCHKVPPNIREYNITRRLSKLALGVYLQGEQMDQRRNVDQGQGEKVDKGDVRGGDFGAWTQKFSGKQGKASVSIRNTLAHWIMLWCVPTLQVCSNIAGKTHILHCK